MIEPEDFETQAGGDFRMCQEAKIYKAYKKTLIDNNAVDFDDLLLLTVRLLRENRDILESYQERLRYIMAVSYTHLSKIRQLHLQMVLCRSSVRTAEHRQMVQDSAQTAVQSLHNYKNIKKIMEGDCAYSLSSIFMEEKRVRYFTVIKSLSLIHI